MTNETRSPKEIERDIERERAGLTNTLSDLQDRFSIESLARQVSDQVREHGGDIGRSVSDAVKRNPLALALTGAGLAWLMLSDRSGGHDHAARDARHGRFDDDDKDGRYGRRHGHDARSGVADDHRSRPVTGTGRFARPEKTPSWARDHDSDGLALSSRAEYTAPDAAGNASEAASGAGGSGRGPGASVADTTRRAAGSVTDTLKGAADGVADTGRAVADSARAAATSASDRAAAMRARLAEGTEALSEEARDRVIAARESAIEARDASLRYARQGRDMAVDIFEEQPLIAGALALAVGAAIGAALPRSRTEDRYLGEQSDRLMEEAERLYAEEKEKLGKVAEAATDEARKIAQETRDEVDSAAKSAIDKAKTSGERIAGAAETEAEKQNLGDVQNRS